MNKTLWIVRLVHALTVAPFRVVHALTVALLRINGRASNKEPVFTCNKTPVVGAALPVDSLAADTQSACTHHQFYKNLRKPKCKKLPVEKQLCSSF